MDVQSCYDMDSVSQISALDSASQTGGSVVEGANRALNLKQYSSDSNIHRSVAKFSHFSAPEGDSGPNMRRGQFPYAYIRSKLAVLPEENAGQVSRRESMNRGGFTSSRSECGIQVGNREEEDDEEDDDVPSVYAVNAPNKPTSGYTSLRARKLAMRRKRSLSVADLPVGEAKSLPKSQEESGYDSDATRKSSPRGSLKNGCEENKDASDTNSSSQDSFSSDEMLSKLPKPLPEKPKTEPIPKPPRKSKLPEPIREQPRRFKKNMEPEAKEGHGSNSHIPRLITDTGSSSLTSKRFKMLRLKKDPPTGNEASELGIVISKKRNPQKGTSGYCIAHIEPGGLVER